MNKLIALFAILTSLFYSHAMAKGQRINGTVDFDAIYGPATGNTLVSNINSAITQANVGDTILFSRSEYDFSGQALFINKGVCISGIAPSTANPNHVGAYSVRTVFKNLRQLHLRADNISLTHLELAAHTSTPYVFTRLAHLSYPSPESNVATFYLDLSFHNVTFRGGRVQAFGGNGAGVTFRQVSFLEFRQGGYYTNRRGRIAETPQVVMKKCFFKPDFDAVNFNVRGISLDAGNDEYPVVWDQNETLIDSCRLDGTGLGIGSKTSHVHVTNSHFIGYRQDVDMIHIEEFGHSFLIDGNRFEHINPARGIYIDRELQQNHDIVITNNTWIGTYAWIISSDAPYNLRFENNDFTQAAARNVNDVTFEFAFDRDDEQRFQAYELPTTDIIFRNNPGLAAKDGILSYKALQNDSSVDIIYPTSNTRVSILTEMPQSIFDPLQSYRIQNVQSGEYLGTLANQDQLSFSATTSTDSSDLWAFSFEYPYYYHIKNLKTGRYMEVWRGYTLGDMQNGVNEQIFVEQLYPYQGEIDLPRWYFRPHQTATGQVYEIMPGGNERKSRVVKVGANAELELAQELNNGLQTLPRSDISSWRMIPTGTTHISPSHVEPIKIYPNPSSQHLDIEGYGEGHWEISTVQGSVVGRGKGRRVDTSQLAPGIYFITSSEHPNQRQKFIKK